MKAYFWENCVQTRFPKQIIIRKFSFPSVHPKIINAVRLFQPRQRIFQRPLSTYFKNVWFQLRKINFPLFSPKIIKNSVFYLKLCQNTLKYLSTYGKTRFQIFSDNPGHKKWHLLRYIRGELKPQVM